MTSFSKRLPAEWEKQSAILLTWPHAMEMWGQAGANIEIAFADIAKAISQTQTLIIGAYDKSHQQAIFNLLQSQHARMDNIFFYVVPSNDVWARDHGPITIYEDDKTVYCDFKFNAWGDKYPSDLDDKIPQQLFAADLLHGYEYRKVDFVLEGGAIETDGKGTLLTTAHCLQERNKHLSRTEIAAQLKEHLGFNRIIWLEHGKISGDDTDSHIDTLARFFNENTIAYVACDNPNDPHFAELAAMEESLKALRTPSNQPYQLIPLPLPDPIYDPHGQRLPATYANFLLTNHSVLVPLYEDKQDKNVLAIFKTHFPDREIIGINCRPVIAQYGSLHCLTMQIPQPISLAGKNR